MVSDERKLLARVSRSFYLSLRFLPGPMRPVVSCGYLLARASDTLADTAAVPVEERLRMLDGFAEEVESGERGWRAGGLGAFLARQSHEGEKELLLRLDEVFRGMERLSGAEEKAVKRVLGTIVSGQRLDLLRFGGGGTGELTRDELLDYCYRVAGCVGEFWTEVGFLTLGAGFSRRERGWLLEEGRKFGVGLQLVNILRDVPEDLAAGRRYVPGVRDLFAKGAGESHAWWRERAREGMAAGLGYAGAMSSRRVRMSVALPALLGMRTLDLMAAAGGVPKVKVKVSRRVVWRSLIEALGWPHQ